MLYRKRLCPNLSVGKGIQRFAKKRTGRILRERPPLSAKHLLQPNHRSYRKCRNTSVSHRRPCRRRSGGSPLPTRIPAGRRKPTSPYACPIPDGTMQYVPRKKRRTGVCGKRRRRRQVCARIQFSHQLLCTVKLRFGNPSTWSNIVKTPLPYVLPLPRSAIQETHPADADRAGRRRGYHTSCHSIG